MKKIKATLTPEQIQCLKNQTFSDNEPGTLLKDFSTLLDFIGSTGIPVSGKNHLIAIKLLPQLNQLMSIPLDVKLNVSGCEETRKTGGHRRRKKTEYYG